MAALVLKNIIAAFAAQTLSPDSALGRLVLGAAHSDSVRETLNSIAFHQWIQHPIFGVGYGMARVAHNLYIQMLDVAGVVGFLPWLCALSMPLVFLLINRVHGYARNEAAAIFAAIVALMAKAWFSPSITDLNSSIIFGLALYLALNPHFSSDADKKYRYGSRAQ